METQHQAFEICEINLATHFCLFDNHTRKLFEMCIDNSAAILHDFSTKRLTLPSCPARYLDTSFSNDNDKGIKKGVVATLPFAKTGVFNAKIDDAKIIVDGENVKKCIEILFDVSDMRECFLPGDTVGILPENNEDDVHVIIGCLNLGEKADITCSIILSTNTAKKNAKLPEYIPQRSTIRKILKKTLNLRSVPKKQFLRSLIDYTDNPDEKQLLKVLCSKEGASTYSEYITNKRTPVVDIFKMCPSCCPPASLLFEHLPALLPRPYSIANSPLKSPNQIKILFSINENSEAGLTTSMLERLVLSFVLNKSDHYVKMYLRERNMFKYSDSDLCKNIIMIGVGCAVSPFVGFMEHRQEILKLNPIQKSGLAWLFTGSRYTHSAVYGSEFRTYLKTGIVNELFESFSRDGTKPEYVHDQINQNSEALVQLLMEEDTTLYVCADGMKISKDVQQTILKCLMKELGKNEEEALQTIQILRKNFKYVEDVWL